MSAADYILLAGLTLCVFLALRSLYRRRGQGCGGNCGNCNSCDHCASRKRR